MLSLTKDDLKDFSSAVLDRYLEEQALRLNKVVGGVETAAEQCAAFNSISDTMAVSLLNSILYELEQMRSGSESIYLAEMEKNTQDYICGRSEQRIQTTTPEEAQIGEYTKSDCVLLLIQNPLNSDLVDRYHPSGEEQGDGQESH